MQENHPYKNPNKLYKLNSMVSVTAKVVYNVPISGVNSVQECVCSLFLSVLFSICIMTVECELLYDCLLYNEV